MQIVQRFVLARLRNRRFFSLDELNAAIRDCVADLNAKIMRKLGKSRRELFETIERPALKPLPAEPYRYAEWKRAALPPTTTSRSPTTITRCLRGSSAKSSRPGSRPPPSRFSIAAAASPATLSRPCATATPRSRNTCRARTDATPSGRRRASCRRPRRSGRQRVALFEAIMQAKPHPEQGFRSCLGILRLAKEYGVERLDAACRRGNDIGARSYGSIASILKHGLDRAYAHEKAPEGAPIQHANIRGQGYYH